MKSTLRTSPFSETRLNPFLTYLLVRSHSVLREFDLRLIIQETDLCAEFHQPCLTPLLTCQQTESIRFVFRRLSNEG